MFERDGGVMLGHRWLLEEHAKLLEKHDAIRWMIPLPQGFMCVVATRRTRRNTNLAPQRNITMNANEIFFGLEFETTLPNSDTTPIGPYHNGYQVPWLPNGWKAERDGSIRPESPCRKGCEFVSPKLKGYDGLKEIEEAIDQINARGGRVNSSCGLHLSIDWRGDAAALARLISLVGNHEKAIFASTGTRRREQTIYTKQIKQYGDKDAAKNRCEADRYHLLNLTHLAAGRNRIEFRAFAGTLNKTKVVGYLMMVLGLVELALNTKRCSDWDYIKKEGTKSCWDRPGAGLGETEINRLFYRLGWTKGWYKGALRDKVYGEITGETKPDWKAIKTKLIELARKYDRAA
ncbi:Putative amidoligase enzyme [Pirellula sp. SH-Sr6A]|nr:Putative amidoligase enzyme [Pirellula sp. SH-Sr6A]